MNTEDIKNMTTAYLQVLEESKKKKDGMNKMPDEPTMKKEKKKLDPVDKNALKGDHDDREDGDIDNDGDIDASDEYLHNRRKTIKKSMKDESYGNVTPKMAKGVMMGKGSNLPKINKGVKMGKPIAAKSMGKTITGKSEAYDAQPKSKVSLAPNNPLDKMKARDKAKNTFKDIKNGKYKGVKMSEETSKNRWPIYNKIMENRAMQTKGATEPEGMYSKSSEGEKAFIAMHTPNGGVDPKFDANVAAEKTAQSIANSVKPGTGNEAASNAVLGDKTIRK